MNFIQTLYIDSDKDPFRDPFGWAAPEYHLMGWALSCLQLQAIYGKVALYANSQAAHLLVDTLQLPFSDVWITHDRLTLPHSDLWALAKIYTYSQQTEPFLHVDGDVFIFNPFDASLLEGELIAQNVEVATKEHYLPAKKLLMKHLTFFPSCVKKDFERITPFQACNAGVLGGSNLSFFRDYSATSFDYVYKNTDRLKIINQGMFNMFFEQHLFYALAKEKGLSVSVVIDGIFNDIGYKHLGNFHEVPFNRSYLHLIGPFKRDEFICISMAAKLRELYPAYYERIIALFRGKNIRLSPCGFMNPTTKQKDIKANTHLRRLKQVMNRYTPPDNLKALFLYDFKTFYEQIISFLQKDNHVNDLYKRDSSTQQWFDYLFADRTALLNCVVVRCPEAAIIKSSFNWAGLFNKDYRVAMDYYSTLQVEKRQFFNLIVPEATDNGFSLYDVNVITQTVFQHLSDPISVRELLVKLQMYFKVNVVQNHYDRYEMLIVSSLEHLVLIKAARPVITSGVRGERAKE